MSAEGPLCPPHFLQVAFHSALPPHKPLPAALYSRDSFREPTLEIWVLNQRRGGRMLEHAILGAYCNPISHLGSEKIPARVPLPGSSMAIPAAWLVRMTTVNNEHGEAGLWSMRKRQRKFQICCIPYSPRLYWESKINCGQMYSMVTILLQVTNTL